MSNSKESELNNAILRYICECQVSGDFRAIASLGIGAEVQEMLKTMTVQEVLHTANIRSTFIKSIRIDSDILKKLFVRAHDEADSQQLVNNLIAHGAPLKLLKELKGINALEFSTIRRLQNVEFRGRTNLPTLQEESIIIEACKKLDTSKALTGEQWIYLSMETDLPIRLIYKVLCEAEEIANGQITKQ